MRYRSKQTVEAMQWRGATDTAGLREFLGQGVLVAEAGPHSLFLANAWKGTGDMASIAARIVVGDFVFKNGDGFALYGPPGSGQSFLDNYEQVSP